MTLNQYKMCVKAPTNLVAELKRILGETCSDYDESNNIDELDFLYEGRKYSVLELGYDSWVDGGKYQYGGCNYQLVSYDESITGYCCEKAVIDHYDIKIYLPCSRTGSYYSDYYYSYHIPEVYRITVKLIPEQIIPAHEEIAYEEI